MSILEEINEEALHILNASIAPCVFLFFSDFFAVSGDLNHPRGSALDRHSDEAMPCISIEGTGQLRSVNLHNWSQVIQNVLGIRFQETSEVPVEALGSAEQLTLKGRIEGGPGKRLLFEALGSRTVTCRAEFPSEVFGPDIRVGEPISFTFDLQRIDVDFYSESKEDLQALLGNLRSLRNEVSKRQNLSLLKGDFAPFMAWAGIDPVTGMVKYPATDKFNELFE